MTPAEAADAAQDRELFLDVLPAFWRSLYDRLRGEGFTEQQAWELLKAYVGSIG